jgi:hypothetical protein
VSADTDGDPGMASAGDWGAAGEVRAARRVRPAQRGRPHTARASRPPTSRPRPAQLRLSSRGSMVLPPLRYGSVAEWVTEFLFPTYRREVTRAGVKWCPRWWAHAEAIGRLEALWRAWEHQRQDPALGAAIWWRDYADPTMAVLFSQTGPFGACRATRHHDRDPIPELPQEPPPAALFPDVRSTTHLRRRRTPRG